MAAESSSNRGKKDSMASGSPRLNHDVEEPVKTPPHFASNSSTRKIELFKTEIKRLLESEGEVKAPSVNYVALLKEKEDQISRLAEENGLLKQNLISINASHGPSKTDLKIIFNPTSIMQYIHRFWRENRSDIASLHSEAEACYGALQSWVSEKFMTGCVVLFPVAVTFILTWWFIQFVDGFFSPIYQRLGIEIFGFGFITTIIFILCVGIFASSWLGDAIFLIGDRLIKQMPFVKHIYSASKQISAISADQNTTVLKEVVCIRHPGVGEYALGFTKSALVLKRDDGDEDVCSAYVTAPTLSHTPAQQTHPAQHDKYYGKVYARKRIQGKLLQLLQSAK